MASDHVTIPNRPPGSIAISSSLLLILVTALAVPMTLLRIIDQLAMRAEHLHRLSSFDRPIQAMREPGAVIIVVAAAIGLSWLVHGLLIRLLSDHRVTIRGTLVATTLIQCVLILPAPLLVILARWLQPRFAGPTGDGVRELTLFLTLLIALHVICSLIMLPRVGPLAPFRAGHCAIRSVLLRVAMLLFLALTLGPAWLVGL